MMLNINRGFLLASLIVIATIYPVCSRGQVQSQEKNYSLLMMSFAKGMQWPGRYAEGDFVIGVLEYPPLASELLLLSKTTRVGNRPVLIKEFSGPDVVDHCHILFVPAYKAKILPRILTQIGSEPVLVITNKMDYARKGAGINFVLVGGKLKYEMNSKAVEERGLKISSNLKGMGIAIN